MNAQPGGVAIIPGPAVRDDVVLPGEGWADLVRKGQVLRIVDLAGKQGVDFLCYAADHPEERYHGTAVK